MANAASNHDAPAAWHLCWQAAVGRDIFVEPELYARVRERLIDAHRRHGRLLVDYLLLPREIHVVSIVMPDDSPGRVARAIGNVVARWVREEQPVRSPVFAGRFVAARIEGEEGIRHVTRMLAWRPVALGLCRTPIHYVQSALRTTLGQRPAEGFDARPLLRLFGPNVRDARAAMRKWLAKRPDERASQQWLLMCGLARATGSTGIRASVSREIRRAATASLVAAGGREGIDGALRLLDAWVGARLGVGPVSARAANGRQSPRLRALVACLAVDHGLCSAASVARHYGKAKATLSEQMSACRKRPADRLILARPLDTILAEALSLTRRPNRETRP